MVFSQVLKNEEPRSKLEASRCQQVKDMHREKKEWG
jgi:hypothetical protein